MRVTAKQEARERGLAGVCQSPRGYVISVDGKRVGSVGWSSAFFASSGTKRDPWYWYAAIGKTSRNTASNKCFYATKEEARDACIEWVKATWRATPFTRDAKEKKT